MRWEYLIVGLLDIRQDNQIRFDKYGREGWELIDIENNTAYFKRQIMSIYDDDIKG